MSYRPPTLFNILWRAVSPFIDPNTRDKLVFLSAKNPPGAGPGDAGGGLAPGCVAAAGGWQLP